MAKANVLFEQADGLSVTQSERGACFTINTAREFGSTELPRADVGELFNAIGRYLSDGDPSMAIEIEPRERKAIFGEVHVERQKQDAQWGGAAHDDDHTATTDGACWRDFITRQSIRAESEHQSAPNATEALAKQRARYVKMAALAIAGIESIDRLGRTS